MKLYKVIRVNRWDITDPHYQIDGGLTFEEIMKMYNISKEELEEALKDGFLGKDGLYEYEIYEDSETN